MKKIVSSGSIVLLIMCFLLSGCNSSKKEEALAKDNNSSIEIKEETDRGPRWELVNTAEFEQKVYAVGFLNDSFGVTVGYGGETCYTINGGEVWEQSDNVSVCRFGLDILDQETIMTCGNGGENMLSNDGARTFTKLSNFDLVGGEPNKLLSMIDKDIIWIASGLSLGCSYDGGNTWDNKMIPKNCNIVGMRFISELEGYLLDDKGMLYKTVDGANSWDLLSENDSVYYQNVASAAINFNDNDEGIMVYIDKESFMVKSVITYDGGKTFTEMNIPEYVNYTPYLSNDGKYLTLTDTISCEILIFSFKAGK